VGKKEEGRERRRTTTISHRATGTTTISLTAKLMTMGGMQKSGFN
jgi:hypothetical protein